MNTGDRELLEMAAKAIGHRDIRMLMRYYNESADDVANRL